MYKIVRKKRFEFKKITPNQAPLRNATFFLQHFIEARRDGFETSLRAANGMVHAIALRQQGRFWKRPRNACFLTGRSRGTSVRFANVARSQMRVIQGETGWLGLRKSSW